MFFTTLDEYGSELNEIKLRLENIDKRIKLHPERAWIKGNRNSLAQIFDMLSKDREFYLKMIDESTNLHFINENGENTFLLSTIPKIAESLDIFANEIYSSFKNQCNFDVDNSLPVKKVFTGSLHFVFTVGDKKTDLRQVQLNYDVLNALFDILECRKEDLPKLFDRFGSGCINSYNNFLGMLIDNDLKLVLENNTRKVVLTPEDANRICHELKNIIW